MIRRHRMLENKLEACTAWYQQGGGRALALMTGIGRSYNKPPIHAHAMGADADMRGWEVCICGFSVFGRVEVGCERATRRL